jgi:hypothetical protein
MKRRALIIYCDNTPSGKLRGTIRDAQNVKSFLTSLAGGEWRNDEIGFLRNPTGLRVKTVVNSFMKDADYTFTVFSGHGFININAGFKQYLELANGNMPLDGLITNAHKQTIIVDACREYFSAHRESLLEEESSFLGDVEHLDRPSTRLIFDNAVKASGKGINVLYSASQSETALDTPSGGAFLFSLLQYAQNWSITRSRFSYLPMDTALIRAKRHMYQKFDTNQNPTIRAKRGAKLFPIAVKFPHKPIWLELV